MGQAVAARVIGSSDARRWAVPPWLPIAVGSALLALVCALALRESSVVLDNQRYFFLDDDQMISMRYARNLVEGKGLVWNVGDRVEGYTNFGWVLVMAAVHGAGVPERLTSLVVGLINIGLGVMVLILADGLICRLVRPPLWLRTVALVTLGLSIDLVFWVVNGFETTLLTAVFLAALVKALDDASSGAWSVSTCLLAGLLPIVRSDAADLTAVVAIVGWMLGARRRSWAMGLMILPLAAHLSFRLWYYGDWLPNTYYLKVAGRSGLIREGLGYTKGFAAAYPSIMILAAAAFFIGNDRRARILLVSLGLVPLHVMAIGADMFQHYRFFAPTLPVLLCLAVFSIAVVTDQIAARLLAATLLVTTVMVSGINGPQSLVLSVNNGMMEQNVVAGVLIDRYTRHDCSILVAAAGAAGYFSHRTAFDLLGKVDREVSHLPARPFEVVGHNRYDIDRSLAHGPDLIVSLVPNARAQNDRDFAVAINRPQLRFSDALLTNQTFLTRYLPHPVPLPYLLRENAIFVRDDSPELAGVGRWREFVLTH